MNVNNKCDQRLSQSFGAHMMATSVSAVGSGRCVGQQSQQQQSSAQTATTGQTTTQTQTTQTSMSSAALPALSAQQLITIATTTAPLTPTVARKAAVAAQSNHRHKHQIPVRTNDLFEGSHIHFSPVDNKPLCSYSTKLCKQRRINGYAFCIRHILEDPSAPFRQCRHVAKYNQQKCSNAIPANEDREFCNSHMQIAGMAPKKERKEKKAPQTTSQLNNKSLNNNICVTTTTAVDNNLTINTVLNEKLFQTSDKFTNFNAFIKPNVKLNGIANSTVTSSVVNTNTSSFMINNNLNLNQTKTQSNNNLRKSTEKSTTTGVTIGATGAALVANETSSKSSHINNFKLNNNSNQLSLNSSSTTKTAKDINPRKAKPKRKKKDKKSVDKFVFARRKKSKKTDNIFNHHIWSESDDEDDDTDDEHRLGGQSTSATDSEDVFPLICGTLGTNLFELESNEMKSELIAQKWLLKNLITVRKKDFSPQLERTRNILKTLNTSENRRNSYLDYKLSESTRRIPNSITKGICCYTSDESRCGRPSLPYTRHCVDHILYNVDQLLFARCTAKCAQTMTQCSRSTFDIEHEEPLCHYHQMVGQEVEERPNSPSSDSKSNNKKRKKSKPMALTRVSRRGKKRKKGPNGADIPVIVEDSIESRLSIGSLDEDSLHSHSDTTNDISINLLPQKADQHQNSADIVVVKHHIQNINISSITRPTTCTTTSSIPAPDIPLLRLPPLVMPTVATTHTTVSSIAPVTVMPTTASLVLDSHHHHHSVMPPPPPLEPTEEALVASIVADLPNDPDFTEVLNKIPDEAFSDFLLEHQNGEIPSTEETEALEQALAMVNKDVQNLVAVAGMNGNSTQLSDLGGQTDIIGFTNWFGSLTTEQRQQLNGLIDGAIASNSLSPILKNACEAYPSAHQSVQPSSALPIMKSSLSSQNSMTNAFPVNYPINQLSLAPALQQEFVPISSPVPILNSNLLMNGLSPHPS